MAGLHADRQTNMQMNQPVWFVEDKQLMSNEEGKKKLQEVADANSKSQQRLTIALAKGKAVLLCIICMTHHPETVATRPHKHLAHFWQTSVNHYFSLRPILCGS